MSETAVVVLLAALEPGIGCTRLVAALELLGQPPSVLDDAVAEGRVRLVDARVEPVDPSWVRSCLHAAGDSARRSVHLALAYAGQGPRTPSESRAVLDRLGHDLSSGPHGAQLTGRERCVAELAATGATSREIAAATYLSPKTVEHHLSRIYRKLGVRSKSELAWSYASYAQVAR